jgi:NADH:ubiquinone oxidoreductase subunit 5 (subunit L)/multisubunit Na+/H+ antiporter MnhA subunit
MFAYLDPASGSMILSVIAGGIAGIAVFFKSFGSRIWSAIAFWKKDDAQADAAADDGAPAVADEPVQTTS